MAAGYEKMRKALTDKADTSARKQAEARMADVEQLISTLRIALKRYTSLTMDDDGAVLDSEGDQNIILSVLDERRPVSGMLDFVINKVHGISMSDGAFVEILVDGESVQTSVLHANDIFQCQHPIANASELMVTLRAHKGDPILAVAFFRLDWVFPGLEIVTEWSQGIEFEPIGSAHVYAKLNRQVGKSFSFIKPIASVLSSADHIGRQVVIRRKVHLVLGHRFEGCRFYRPIRCARCSEFILNGSAYQCQNCRYLCHKKCHDSVYYKCPAAREEDQAEQSIPPFSTQTSSGSTFRTPGKHRLY